jgi:hypothetical protein
VDITASQGVQAIPELASVDWLFASLWGQSPWPEVGSVLRNRTRGRTSMCG